MCMLVLPLLATMAVYVPLNMGWPIVNVQKDFMESIVKEVCIKAR